MEVVVSGGGDGGKQRRRRKYAEMENAYILLYFDDLHNISYACTYSKRNETCVGFRLVINDLPFSL
jgi:hypothetical protein